MLYRSQKYSQRQTYYVDRPMPTMLLFQNGKAIIAGAKSEKRWQKHAKRH
jgi:TATA-box binding protein (TBP) (component of TFIID and TFIIIB)